MPKIQNPGDCACFNLRRASRLVAQVYDRYLLPSGLTNTQFALFAALSKLGPFSITGLAESLGMERTTLTRNLKLVERQGLVGIGPGKDARSRDVRLTDAGKAALEKAMPLWNQAQIRMVKTLGPDHFGSLLTELRTVAEAAPTIQ
jgi:DNA-binding MarR family transcriptional regulator